MIGETMEVELTERPVLKGTTRQKVADLPVLQGGFLEKCVCLGIGLQFEFENQFHVRIIPDGRIFLQRTNTLKESKQEEPAAGRGSPGMNL